MKRSHKWKSHPTNRRSRYNAICTVCGCEKIANAECGWGVEYHTHGKIYNNVTPSCINPSSL